MPEEIDTVHARLKAERDFFDDSVANPDRFAFSYYTESFLSIIEKEAEKFLPDLRGKRLLFYGCGVNWTKSYHFYNCGANIVAIDISPASIQMMQQKAKFEGVQHAIEFVEMDCENLDYPDESFDVIYGRAILHHLNLHKANRQLLRVLKKEGVAVFIEPLGMNPVINLYRYLTPHLRTVDEKPLDYSDIRVIGEGFSQVKHKEMTLTPLPAIILQYGLQFLGIRFTNLRPFYQLDEKLFRLLPYLKQLSWNVILALQK